MSREEIEKEEELIFAWANYPLSWRQIQYAALDSRLGFEIARRHWRLLGYNSKFDEATGLNIYWWLDGLVWCGTTPVLCVVWYVRASMYEIWFLSAIMNFLLQFLLLLSCLNAFIIAISNFFFILVVKHLRNMQDNSLVCKITHLLNISEMLLSKTSYFSC